MSKRVGDGSHEDYLGLAAQAGARAGEAVRGKMFDDAWRLYHEQQMHYINHANRNQFTPEDALNLTSSVNERLADILRLQGRHKEALIHIVYLMTVNTRITKSQCNKLGPYFRRCKFESKNIEDAQFLTDSLITNTGRSPDFSFIRDEIGVWA